jgi:hypothetical protein
VNGELFTVNSASSLQFPVYCLQKKPNNTVIMARDNHELGSDSELYTVH